MEQSSCPINGNRVIGVISDTHDLLRPQVSTAFDGVDLIIHAGDICSADVLDQLARIAPVIAVRGNNDKGDWANELETAELVEVESKRFYVVHDLNEFDFDSLSAGLDAVISGHSHRPSLQQRGAVIYLNPGSAGPRRFKLPVSVAKLYVHASGIKGELIEL